jgi:glutathione S-transferase
MPAFFSVHRDGEHPSAILDAIDILQSLLPEEGGFALGRDVSMADAAVVTMMARAEVGLENDLGAYDEGEGRKSWDRVMKEEKYEKFRRWFNGVKARKSFQDTWDPVSECF